jgi:7,8-dihydroneopterin 2',3'-cyclic phosphate phosphodiesterase
MEELIELAKLIKDENLRKKVIDFLKNPEPSHPEFKKYKKTDFKKVKTFFTTSYGTVIRDVYNHTITLTKLCIETAKILEENYGIEIDLDSLIAAAILHDVMKSYEWLLEDEIPKPSNILLDHTMLITAELYHRNFPEKVIHIVASHFGEHGPTPPRTLEAFILHSLDSFLSMVEANLALLK